MRKKYCFIITSIILCVSAISARTTEESRLAVLFNFESTPFCAGDGTFADPYQICTAADLATLAVLVNAGGNASQNTYYRVMNDIDLSDYSSGEGWIPIGINDGGYRFQGHFDGNDKTLSNLTINRVASAQGLFGCTQGATIKNLNIENCYINGDESVGGMVGVVFGGTMTHCSASGMVTGSDEVGGLFGYSNSLSITNSSSSCTVAGHGKVGCLAGSLLHSSMANCNASGNVSGILSIGGLAGTLIWAHNTNCYATGNVSGNENIGGLAGNSSVSSNTSCYATGNISGETKVGGLLGNNSSDSHILNCYATGNVTATDDAAGGLVGYNDNSIIESCYATGALNGEENVGGLVGENFSALIENCYATGSVSGSSQCVGGLVGYCRDYSSILNCYAIGNVSGVGSVGGLVGNNFSTSIANSYATGNIKGNLNVGGLVGLSNNSSITNCYAFNCKVEATAGTSVGRIAGLILGTTTLSNNYGYDQMKLWANGSLITTLIPTPAADNMHGADVTFASAPPQAKMCGEESVVFYANNVFYEDLNDTTFCDKLVNFQAEVAGFNAAPDSIKWFFDDVEYVDARDLLQWSKTFDPGAHNILVEMQVFFDNGETLSKSGTLHVRVFWTKMKNIRH